MLCLLIEFEGVKSAARISALIPITNEDLFGTVIIWRSFCFSR
jgi:hypothetical protein